MDTRGIKPMETRNVTLKEQIVLDVLDYLKTKDDLGPREVGCDMFDMPAFCGKFGNKLVDDNLVFRAGTPDVKRSLVSLYERLHSPADLADLTKIGSDLLSQTQKLVLYFKNTNKGHRSGVYKHFLSAALEEFFEQVLTHIMLSCVNVKAQLLFKQGKLLVGTGIVCWVGAFEGEIREKEIDACIYEVVRVGVNTYNRMLLGLDTKEYIDSTMRGLIEAIILYKKEIGWSNACYLGISENKSSQSKYLIDLRNQKRNRTKRDAGDLGNDFQYERMLEIENRVTTAINYLVDNPLEDVDISKFSRTKDSLVQYIADTEPEMQDVFE
jgi:hypothetical protein